MGEDKGVRKPVNAARLEQHPTAVLVGHKRPAQGTTSQEPAEGTMRIDEVAEYLGVNHGVVRKLVKDKSIPRLAGTGPSLVPVFNDRNKDDGGPTADLRYSALFRAVTNTPQIA